MALRQLADSIRQQGVLQPILVRQAADRPGHYEIVAGERRWRAAQLVGLDAVPAIVRNESDIQSALMALTENIQRADLNCIDEALAMQRILDEYGISQKTLALSIGVERSFVANRLRLLRVSDATLDFLEQGTLSPGHGRVLAELPPLEQDALARACMSGSWSVRRLEQEIRRLRSKTVAARPARKDRDVERLEQAVSDALSAPVELQIADDGRSGEVRIRFHSLDELDGLLERFRVRER